MQFLFSLSLARGWNTPLLLIPGALIVYLVLVRVLRYRRRDGLIEAYKSKYGVFSRDTLPQMALEDAWSILKTLMELEFPTIISFSLTFALFKTYGIPTISKLLAATGELANDKTASKRAADTGVLISEFVLNPPDSVRRFEGIARMNYLHSMHRKAGKISDDDMLYTLSLFALEPVRWVNRYDWRKLTELELTAMGVFWRDIGEAMEIPYVKLESYMGGYRDGLDWLEALDKWSLKYEEDFMVPADTNEKVAWATLNLLLFGTPTFLRGFKLKLISALLEDRLRVSMRLEKPGRIHRYIVSTLMTLNAWAVRNIHPPRPRWLRQKMFEDEPDPKTGKFYSTDYMVHPWYVKPTFWSRWSPDALWTRIWGGYLPGDCGMRFHPDGYHIAEVGPEGQEGRGQPEMEKNKAQMLERRATQRGCPLPLFRKA